MFVKLKLALDTTPVQLTLTLVNIFEKPNSSQSFQEPDSSHWIWDVEGG